jgi:uncharacterized protein YprB with RNaseH-like and TPR domain
MASPANKFSRVSALKPARPGHGPAPVLRPADEEDMFARLTGAGVARNRFGEHLCLRLWHATPELTAPTPVALELLSRTRDEAVSRRTRTALADPEKWLFLDTETTGLAGGTGIYAFLIGLAWWDAGGLQLEQLFMRDFSEEYSVLEQLASRLKERPVLVTFNGKSFDWPLLENRFAMTRTIPIPVLAAHLDLLHPARALWKMRLGTVRLVDLEEHVLDAPHLGWNRQDDIASAMIPQYYFDYLRGGTAVPLLGVARHNQMDLRGLAALYAKVDAMLSTQDPCANETNSIDLLGLSHYLQRRGEADRAHETCSKALDFGLPAEFRPRASRELAMMAKRRGNHDHAVALWHELVNDPQDGLHACEQLAIYYERRAKDFLRAQEFARLGIAKAQRLRVRAMGSYGTSRAHKLEQLFVTRLARLARYG